MAEKRNRGIVTRDDQVEVLPRAHVGVRGQTDRPEGEPDEDRTRDGEDCPPARWSRPMATMTIRKAGRTGRLGAAPIRSPRWRCRGPIGVVEDPVIYLVELEPEEDVERGLENRPVHGRGRHQGRGDESRVAHRDATRSGHLADEGSDADADREEIEDWHEEAGDHHLPHPAVDQVVPLLDALCPERCHPAGRESLLGAETLMA